MAGWGGVGPWRAAGPAPGQAGDRPFKGGAWGQEVVWVGGGWVARRWGSLAVQPCWHGMAWGVGAPMLAIPPSWPPPPSCPWGSPSTVATLAGRAATLTQRTAHPPWTAQATLTHHHHPPAAGGCPASRPGAWGWGRFWACSRLPLLILSRSAVGITPKLARGGELWGVEHGMASMVGALTQGTGVGVPGYLGQL